MQTRYHDLIEDVSQLIADRLHDDADWLEAHHALELDARMFQLMMLIGAAALEKLMERLCSDKVEVCRQDGMHLSKTGDSVSWTTQLGTLEVPSPYLRNPHTGETARPMKDAFGVNGKEKTPALERALSEFGSECSYAEAEARFAEHYGFEIGDSSIRRVTNQVGEDAETYLEHRLDLEEPSPDSPFNSEAEAAEEIMVQLDGCDIRTGAFMTAAQAGLAGEEGYEADDRVRPQQWKEVRVGLIRARGEVTKQYVAQLGDYDDICEQLHALAVRRGLGPETQVISPGDGGNGLKEALEEAFPGLQFILDVPHLKEHFYDTAEALGIDEELRQQWVSEYIDAIWNGDIEDVLDRLRTLYDETSNDRVERLVEHLDRFSKCVNYADYEEAGWPTGSGEVESAHRYLPQARLKLPGACWKVENINPMLAIRVIKKNGWWDDFWNWRVTQREDAA